MEPNVAEDKHAAKDSEEDIFLESLSKDNVEQETSECSNLNLSFVSFFVSKVSKLCLEFSDKLLLI